MKRAAIFLFLFLAFTLYGQDYPRIIPKEEWGGEPPTTEIEEQTISYITIHHGGVFVAEDKDPEQYLQNLQKFSTAEKGWIDIPYHYMIDLQGRVYEARPEKYPGDTNTEYDPKGHLLICVIGNYEEQEPDSTQIESLAWMTAFAAYKHSLSLDVVASHKDYSGQTVCPGKNLYKFLSDSTLFKKASLYLEKLQKEKPKS